MQSALTEDTSYQIQLSKMRIKCPKLKNSSTSKMLIKRHSIADNPDLSNPYQLMPSTLRNHNQSLDFLDSSDLTLLNSTAELPSISSHKPLFLTESNTEQTIDDEIAEWAKFKITDFYVKERDMK